MANPVLLTTAYLAFSVFSLLIAGQGEENLIYDISLTSFFKVSKPFYQNLGGILACDIETEAYELNRQDQDWGSIL
jgi:hypothetical protein